MISYSYLWSDEAAEGHAEGRKNRPCAIVLSTTNDARVPDGKLVAVLPITHTKQDPATSIELPAAVKRHLGLDTEPSWVVLSEMNAFVWPGFDLRPIPGKPGDYVYGHLPPKFFNTVRDKWLEVQRMAIAKAVRR